MVESAGGPQASEGSNEPARIDQAVNAIAETAASAFAAVASASGSADVEPDQPASASFVASVAPGS